MSFQGHLDDSTNGCTAIAPLVLSCHLNGCNNVLNKDIIRIIDKKCVPLLKDIRMKSGLDGYDQIIPSDSLDHLVDGIILCQSQFVGMLGGNILNEKHLNRFL